MQSLVLGDLLVLQLLKGAAGKFGQGLFLLVVHVRFLLLCGNSVQIDHVGRGEAAGGLLLDQAALLVVDQRQIVVPAVVDVVTLLLPIGGVRVSQLGDDLAEMETIFGDTAAYYCSPFNERYRKKYSDLSVCIKDGQQLKDILFTTKAMGVGIGLKDRGVKHIFIDQWNPLEIAQSLGRKRSLDADDTCTVYFRDYGLDWYWGTNSGLKKFRSMLLNKYLPAQAYMAGEEEFDKYLHSDNPEVIQKKIDKSKILEHNVVTGYHINPLGLQQVEHDIEMLDDIMSSTNYPESFMKYAMFNLHQPIKAYRFKDLEDWLYAHLNQPMDPEEMTEKIMSFGYIERYQGRDPGQMGLNKFLPCYGVKIVSDRENKRNENRNKTFWTLIKQ